jgi:hypothetical protein
LAQAAIQSHIVERDNQRRLDVIAMQYLTALDDGDLDTVSELWHQAQTDQALAEMLHGINEELAAEAINSDRS